MTSYAQEIKPVPLHDDPADPDREATEEEITLFRALAGELV